MFFDAEDLPDVAELAGGEQWQGDVRVVDASGGDSTPPVVSNKVWSGTPPRRQLFDGSKQQLTPLSLGTPTLAVGDGAFKWNEVVASAGTFEFVAGARKPTELRINTASSMPCRPSQIYCGASTTRWAAA